MQAGDYLKIHARELVKRKVLKVCSACDWEGVISNPVRKCPECGNHNLTVKSS